MTERRQIFATADFLKTLDSLSPEDQADILDALRKLAAGEIEPESVAPEDVPEDLDEGEGDIFPLDFA